MQVQYSERVNTTLATLGTDDRQRVHTWIQYMKNWDRDPFVRNHSVELTVQGKTVYLFRTSTDVRIFYTVNLDNQTITILDVTRQETILSSGSV